MINNNVGKTIIIGAGPAGLSTAYELTKLGINPLVLEKTQVLAMCGAITTMVCDSIPETDYHSYLVSPSLLQRALDPNTQRNGEHSANLS